MFALIDHTTEYVSNIPREFRKPKPKIPRYEDVVEAATAEAELTKRTNDQNMSAAETSANNAPRVLSEAARLALSD